MLDQILGWTATVLFSLMMIPQIIKTNRTRDIKGVSLLLFITNLVANVIALVYATLIQQAPLQIKYTLAIVTTIIYLYIYIKVALEKSCKT